VKVAEVQTRAEDLVEHIRQEFRAFLPSAIASGEIEIPEDFDERAARAEVAEMRTEVRSLGAVNELALESYEEEKERLDFLTKQRADLELAEEKLLETIREINITASRRFFETFEEIRINFQRLFVDLFGKEAAADLVLENPDDPLETAIEINARPRGKRPSTISQLSGGEKTLTAIALLFGIYLVKPSPFCILDEVDAPLDDANVERFMRLIREFSRETQFILVTHNKRTMEGADRLYGITMQEQGVSRLVGVKFDEAVEMVDRAA
jgi:chromosome segregation protein